MELCLTLDHRFLQTPDDRVWTVTQCPYSFYSEYLEVFDRVRVIARTFRASRIESNFLPVEGPGVEFYPVASYQGPVEFLARYRTVQRSLRNAVPRASAVILRAPSQVANSVERSIRHRKHPFALDVVADPYDVLSPGANAHPLAPIARIYFTRILREQAKRAVAVRYVTQSYLQKRYPPTKESVAIPQISANQQRDHLFNSQGQNGRRQYVAAVSDVNLPEEWFLDEPRSGMREQGVIHALFIGTLGSLYKGPDTLLRAVALSKSQGVRVSARFAGSGKKMNDLIALAGDLGVSDLITFLGDVQSGVPIRNEIDRADVFVLPSRAEGVPRAMLEAMARSAPCLGSDAGGIPELLHEEDRVPPNDAAALALKFAEMLRDKSRVRRMSMRNFRTSRNYATQALQSRHRGFLLAVREQTANRLKDAGRTMVAFETRP